MYEQSFRDNREMSAITDYFTGETYSYYGFAKEIAKLHIMFDEAGIKIVYFPYTQGISSTQITKALDAVRGQNLEDVK